MSEWFVNEMREEFKHELKSLNKFLITTREEKDKHKEMAKEDKDIYNNQFYGYWKGLEYQTECRIEYITSLLDKVDDMLEIEGIKYEAF